MKTLFKLKNLYRLKSNYIKLEHNKLAKEILSLGNEIYVETMNYKALQKKAKFSPFFSVILNPLSFEKNSVHLL